MVGGVITGRLIQCFGVVFYQVHNLNLGGRFIIYLVKGVNREFVI